MGYKELLEEKQMRAPTMGVDVHAEEIHDLLFPFQRDLVMWAAGKGRSAIFADTGLGKTFMQIEWARCIGERTLIVAPLTVARQTVREAEKIGVDVIYSRDGTPRGDITITNYEMVEHFDPCSFGAVVLDESSILKAITSKTREKLTRMFSDTPYRLCCSATPAPNDRAEIGNHAEFLGVMTRADMLASFFVHDDDGWRLKGHATDAFYQWLASWAMSIRKPSDLGYDDDGFVLPPLNIKPEYVQPEGSPEGQLFFTGLKGIRDRQRIRRATIQERCQDAADMINGSDEQWIVWCGLNDESSLLNELIPDAIQVEGTQSADTKAEYLEAFQDGECRVLVTKPRIAGFGMNFQNCHKMAFVGLSDSWEAYYQCIRRCYRFGQEHPVDVRIVLSDWEAEIYDNVREKEKVARNMSARLIENVQEYEKDEIGGTMSKDYEYVEDMSRGEKWTMRLGDSAERISELDPGSVGLSVFSPPFLSLYTYSPTERDVGNSRTPEEFYAHLEYIITGLLEATMPGRVACCHVAQVPAMLVRDGYIGMKDFRGQTIEAFEDGGWIYQGEVCIDKDPQAQAIRTHAKGLAFKQLKKDASWMRPALADYILIFRKPGENPEAIQPDVTNDEWIRWARPVWYGIQESDTLNVQEARENDDERHICPMQLGTIERCVRLWSNEGDLLCDPFAGIGSTGFVGIRYDRRFTGIELKESYYQVAQKNLSHAENSAEQRNLFTGIGGNND